GGDRMVRRREFITLFGGASAWPLAARAQQGERVRRVGIISGVREADPGAIARYTAFRRNLEQLGWIEGRNIRFEYRLGMASNPDLIRKYAAEVIALEPDVVLVAGTPSVE